MSSDTDIDEMYIHVSVPDSAPTAAVVVLMEAFGVNDHIRDVCRRFADLGYLAVAPDLYHRSGRNLVGAYDDHSTVMEYFATLTTDGMADDIAATLDFVAAEHGLADDRTGVIGFCLGGYGAVLAATRRAPAAVAGFYGAGLSIRRAGSPLDPLAPEFGEIACPVRLFYGADDPVIPPEEVDATRSALTRLGIDARVVVYPDSGHGFFCDQRGGYVAESAADAWDEVTRTFAEAL